MDFTLKRWSRPGRAERIYLNDYAEGAAVYVERDGEGDGLRVLGAGGKAPPADQVLADLRARYGDAAAGWAALSRAADRPPPRQPRPVGGSAMGNALLSIALGGRPLPFPVTVLAGPRVPDATLAMLGHVRDLAVERGEPDLCDLAVGDRMAFRLAVPGDLRADARPLVAEASARDAAYARSFLLVEGAPTEDEMAAYGIAAARIHAQTRNVVAAVASPAHAGFVAACLVREIMAGPAVAAVRLSGDRGLSEAARHVVGSIPGLGPALVEPLLAAYGSIRALADADPAEMAERCRIDPDLARRVVGALNAGPGQA
jgi:hypothetical protein